MVLIAGDGPGISVHNPTRFARESIPDRLALSVFIPRALDLVRRRRYAPREVGWEFGLLRHECPPRIPPTVPAEETRVRQATQKSFFNTLSRILVDPFASE